MDITDSKRELKILENLYASDRAEFLVIYGTYPFFVSQFFKDKNIYFELTGIKGVYRKTQIKNFAQQFANTFKEQLPIIPSDWQEAFFLLHDSVKKIDPSQKIIIALNELSLFSTHDNDFLQSLDYIWNRHLSRYSNVILIVSSPDEPWLLKKIACDRGGFYGRLTAEIWCEPCTFERTEK